MTSDSTGYFLGIDLGTSGVKAVVIDGSGDVLAQADAPLTVSRPAPLHSEQDPADWLKAVNKAVLDLPGDMRKKIVALGLTGQMHGAVLLDARNAIIRPAILWNDGRSHAECEALEMDFPELADITGNRAMPGFTAPKLAWVGRHEPENFARIAKILLPKDWLRMAISGEMVSEMSDAAGTLWLDTGKRRWSAEMLDATGLNESHMPELVEGPAHSGTLSPEYAQSWGMGQVPIAGGGGDNAAGAVGCGVAKPGDSMMSIGTSGVIFHVTDSYQPCAESGVHSFCHALPGLWHHMSVMLSAASAIDWTAKVTGQRQSAEFFAAIEARGKLSDREIFLPYLSGERTPHNDPHATGMFFGLTHESDSLAMGQAALEGVAFAYADGVKAIEASGSKIEHINVIGGGSRSLYWGEILASAMNKKLVYRKGADRGPAYGAARLAMLMIAGEQSGAILAQPDVSDIVEPDAEMSAQLAPRYQKFQTLYQNTKAI